jgi:hypothetical protein
MGLVMDLVAGDSREILLAVAVDDLAAFDDRGRFPAHLSFGGSIDPTWLDLFSQAARAVTAATTRVTSSRHARSSMARDGVDRTVERIDPRLDHAIARLDDHELDAIAGRWIDLLEEELGELAREEKPSVRVFATQIVDFARTRGPRAPPSSSPGRCRRPVVAVASGALGRAAPARTRPRTVRAERRPDLSHGSVRPAVEMDQVVP